MVEARAARAVRWAGIATAATGVTVLAGWFLDAPALVRLGDGLPAMQVATALALVATGVGLAVDDPKVRRWSGWFVAALGVSYVTSFLFESPFVLHRLIPLPTLRGGEHATLIAPTSAVVLCFVGIALALSAERRTDTAAPVAALAVLAAGTVGLAVTDLAGSALRGLGLTEPTGRQMAVHTAIAFAVIGVGLLREAVRLRRRSDPTPIAHAVLAGCIAIAVTLGASHAIRVSQIVTVQQGTRSAMQSLTRVLAENPPGGGVDAIVAWTVPRLRTIAPGYVASLTVADAAPVAIVAGDPPTDPIFVERIDVPIEDGGIATLSLWPDTPILRNARRPLGLVVLLLGSTLAVLLTIAIQTAATARARARRLEDALASLAASEARLHESRKMEAVARLAGGMAHEFNNLLSVVRGYTQLLVHEQDGGARGNYVAEIDMASTRGAELTRRLLTVSARHVVNPQPVSLPEFLSEREGMLQRVLGSERRLDISWDGSPVDLRASADPEQLEQSLITLAANARDAMTPGGALRVRARGRGVDPDTADGIGVRAGAYVELEVADTGRGMTTDQLRSIFEPFGGSSERAPGAGLGLAMLYGFTRQSGGAVEVSSRPGRGTTFRLLLPRSARTVLPPIETERAPRGTAAPLVLVAEDQDAVRSLMVRILARAGYEVVPAVNGLDALARIAGREEALDLLLTDMIMPELGGRELTETLRGRHPSLPVLYVSGYADADIAEGTVLRDGRTAFLQKPFTPNLLVSRIRHLLDGDPLPDDTAELAAPTPAA